MIYFTCENCKKTYPIKSQGKRIFCSCGGVSLQGDQIHDEGNFGVGDHMQDIMNELRITEKVGCSCRSLAAKMNRLGIEGCELQREELLTSLRKNAEKYSWLEKFRIGIYNATNPLAIDFLLTGDIANAMLDEALRRAKDDSRPPSKILQLR